MHYLFTLQYTISLYFALCNTSVHFIMQYLCTLYYAMQYIFTLHYAVTVYPSLCNTSVLCIMQYLLNLFYAIPLYSAICIIQYLITLQVSTPHLIIYFYSSINIEKSVTNNASNNSCCGPNIIMYNICSSFTSI